VLSSAPLASDGTRSGRPALADRLLQHLNGLSNDGMVEQPLVDVARDLDVGAPSVSRALGHLVDEGLARVDQVGTRGRPTRIALVEAGGKSDDLARLRSENQRLAQEVARLRERLRDSGA
jgi:predicted ArsR family transcriptional regulator